MFRANSAGVPMRQLLGVITIAFATACGGGGSSETADGPPGGGADAFGSGPPITAPAMTWTWVDFPESRCMNDTPTGIGVNLSPDSRRVLIYLEGGGACFNGFTCATVAHQNGFNATTMQQTASQYGSLGVFDRGDADNPFRDWNYVFVPYCSGDIHAGLNEQGMGGRVMVGYRNIGLYLERLSPTFPDAEVVMLTGSSAGGFGAAYNYDRVAQAFGGRRVVLLDDSGPMMSDTYLTPCLQQLVRDAWRLDDTLPADCTDCRQPGGGGLVNLATHLATKYPDRRKGLITSNRDGVIRTFFGFGYPDCTNTTPMPEPTFAAGVDELVTQILAPYDSFRAFVIDSGVHVWLLDPLGGTTSAGTRLADWIETMLDPAASWATVGP
jgi:hypothetical protein